MSDDGSDENYCHSELAPCKNLQSVIDRAIDGDTIYVTSDTLSLDAHNQTTWYSTSQWMGLPAGMYEGCGINSSISYNLHSLKNNTVTATCSGR